MNCSLILVGKRNSVPLLKQIGQVSLPLMRSLSGNNQHPQPIEKKYIQGLFFGRREYA